MNYCESFCRTIQRLCNNGGGLPAGYTQVEYIRTPPNLSVPQRPYLIIDYYPNSKTEYDIYMGLRIWEAGVGLFGVFDGAGYIGECQIPGSGAHNLVYVSGNTNNYNIVTFALNDPYLKLETNGGVITNNNVTYNYNRPTGTTAHKLPIFTVYSTSTNAYTSLIAQAVLYYFTIREDGVKVVDIVPAIRDSDNVAGAYDLANKKFYENAGNNNFDVGGIV